MREISGRVHPRPPLQEHQDRQLLPFMQRANEANQEMRSTQDFAEIRRIRDETLRYFILRARRITGSKYASIRVPYTPPPGPHPSETEMVLFLVEPSNETDVKETHFPITRGIISEAYLTKRTVLVPDVKKYPGFVASFPDNIESELAVPMLDGDRVVGVFNLESTQPQKYPRVQVRQVEQLASQAAHVLAFAEEHLFYKQLEVLQKLERGILEGTRDSDTFTSEDVFQPILKAALELTEQADGFASFWLTHGEILRREAFYTQEGDAWRDDLAWEIRRRVSSLPAPDSRQNGDFFQAGLVGVADYYQEPQIALDVDTPPWKDLVKLSWPLAQSAIAIPLLDPSQPEGSPARVVGILSVQSQRPRAFSARHMQILQFLAQTALVRLRTRALYQSKITLLRDITHAFEKAIWPLRVSVDELTETPYDPLQAEHFEQQQYKEKVQEIASLTDLAGNLFDWFYQLVKFEDSDSASVMEPTGMVTLVQKVSERMRPFAVYERKQIILEELPPDFQVICVPDLVKAALFLLIENALTYSPNKDSILVRLRPMADGGARMEVIDHGAPIREEERDFLFDPGFRGSAPDALYSGGRRAGSGIGLDHVRRIIEKLHHGKAGYQTLSDGNMFFIELPPRPALPGEGEQAREMDLHG